MVGHDIVTAFILFSGGEISPFKHAFENLGSKHPLTRPSPLNLHLEIVVFQDWFLVVPEGDAIGLVHGLQYEAKGVRVVLFEAHLVEFGAEEVIDVE